MQDPDGFDAFVTTRGDALHDAAYRMTGDHAAAEDLVRSALAKAWPAWRRVAADPETFVRAAIAESYAPPWHRGSSREPVVELAVDGEHLAEPTDLVDRPDITPDDRIQAVRSLLASRQQRRRRVLAGALVVVLVGAAVVGAKSVQQQRHPAHAARSVKPVTAVDPPAARVIPMYYNGGKQLNSIKVDLSREGTAVLPFTPTRWGLDFAYQCPTQMSGTAQFEIRVGGQLVLGSDCVGSDPGGGIGGPQVVSVDGSSGDYGTGNPAAETFWRALGIRLGQPASAVVTVRRAAFAASPPPAMTAVVYQDVLFADYPLPPRPTEVLPPSELNAPTLSHSQAITLPGNAVNGTWTSHPAYRTDLVIQGGVSGPGQIRVHVDGVLVGGYDAYDYTSGGFTVSLLPPVVAGRPPPRAGKPVTITVTITNFGARDWDLQLGRSSS